MGIDTSHWWTADQLEFIRMLERLALYVGEPATDEFRDLIADIQDEFNNLKRGAVRDELAKPGPLTVQDVLDFGGAVGEDFPQAQRGCEVFASVFILEQREYAQNN